METRTSISRKARLAARTALPAQVLEHLPPGLASAEAALVSSRRVVVGTSRVSPPAILVAVLASACAGAVDAPETDEAAYAIEVQQSSHVGAQSTAGAQLTAATAPASTGPFAGRQTATPQDGAVLSDGSDSVWSQFQMFDGAILTESWADSMAEDSGFELIRFKPCPFRTSDCAAFEVIGKNGTNVFEYQVSSESCLGSLSWETAISAGIADLANPRTRAASRTAQTQPSGTALPGTLGLNSSYQGPAPQTSTAADAEADAVACFGGYRVNFRVKVENALYVDTGAAILSVEHAYQEYDGHWRTVATLSQGATTWYEGCNKYGSNSVLLVDADGTVLIDDTEVENLGCASSAPLTGDPAEDCKRAGDAADGLLSGVSDWLGALCDATSLIALSPDSIGLTIAGEGWEATAAKNLNVCAISKSGRESVGEVAGDAMMLLGYESPWLQTYNACMRDPGWFFPSEYGAVLDAPIDFDESVKTLFEEAGAAGGSVCPSSYVGHAVVDMGGGTTCDADVRYSCEVSTAGDCDCTATEVVGDLVCTST